jgi:hypothetical protein
MINNHLLVNYLSRLRAVEAAPWYWPWKSISPLDETPAQRLERQDREREALVKSGAMEAERPPAAEPRFRFWR